MTNQEQYDILRDNLNNLGYNPKLFVQPCNEQEVYEKAYKEGYAKGWSDGKFIGEKKKTSKYRTKSNDELISKLELLKAEIEWNYPLDYQIVLDETIKRLKEKENG